VDGPPVVGEHVEDTQDDDEEYRRPFGLKADSYHDAGRETKNGDEYTSNAPSSLKNKTEEQEDEKDATGKEEIFLAICFADCGNSCEKLLAAKHGVAEHHYKSTDDAKVAEEEVEVENETIAETLNDYNAQKTAHGEFGVAFEDDSTRTGKHGDNIEEEEQVGDTPWKVSVLLQIPELVAPLSENPQRILQESDNNQEAANGGEMRF